ncbi:MAG: SWIM zinc finger domain-containing protein [Candidatus Parvarchaeota archaeon]|nr:SWIM zinc finger domain-containing protein [Candidatus Parvarchaeota archaeon]
MHIELLPIEAMEKDGKRYIKGVHLSSGVKIDYSTAKHISFIVDGEETKHNVMYFADKFGDKQWQCDCKWYALQNKICSHIIAVNLALRNNKISA